MYKNLIISIFFLFSLSLVAQKEGADSLLNILNTHTDQDTFRVNALVDIGTHFLDSDMEQVLSYFKEALAISKAIDAKHHQVTVQNQLAYYYRAKGVWDVAMEQAIIAKKDADAFGTKEQKLSANSGMIIMYANSGSDDKSLEIILENIEITRNDPPSAAKARTYFDAGNLYIKLLQLDKVEVYYTQAIDMCREVGFKPGEMVMLMSLSELYERQKDYTKALQVIDIPLRHYIATNQTVRIGSAYKQNAQLHYLQGNFKKSISIYLKALNAFEESGASLHYKSEILRDLYLAYSIIQNKDQAAVYNRAYNSLQDSIQSMDRKKFTEELKVEYQTDQIAAEKEAAETKAQLAEATSRQNRNYFIGSVIIAALILLSSIFYLIRLRTRKEMELITIELRETQKRLALEKQYKESELKALKAQMDPHFIFNALNSIQEYIITNRKEEASDYLRQFADLIRTYLGHSNTGAISLKEEVNSLDMYLDLEKLRFEEAFQYSISVDETLSPESIYIPTMLIQPYIENATKHGLFHMRDNKRLQVSFVPAELGVLKCIIEDNGVGRARAKALQKERKKWHKPFATKVTQERLDLLNNGKEKKIGVDIIDLYDEEKKAIGTKVVITIPIINRVL